jgi:hypothetical protein
LSGFHPALVVRSPLLPLVLEDPCAFYTTRSSPLRLEVCTDPLLYRCSRILPSTTLLSTLRAAALR